MQLIALRGLFKLSGLSPSPGNEQEDARKFIERTCKLAEEAGGDAPLPKLPDTTHLTDLSQRVGNDQLSGLIDQKARLEKEIALWQAQAVSIQKRQPKWKQLNALLEHAAGLPVAAEVQPEVDAILDQRSLLTDPDPVPGLITKLTGALREEINAAHANCVASHERGLASLDESSTWQKLKPEQRYELLTANSVREIPKVAVGTSDEILDTLRHVKLSEMKALNDALPTRFSKAVNAGAKLLEPKAQHVSLPSTTIKTEDDLREWLAAAEAAIKAKLAEGTVIV